MAVTTQIQWTDHTMNFWKGCTKVSPACQFCYIRMDLGRAGVEPFGGPIRTKAATWDKAFDWDIHAGSNGVRRRTFTCSLSDFFHPGADAWRPEAWQVIRSCPNLDWQILTKRPERIAEHLPPDWDDGYDNVWLGVTVENSEYRSRLRHLLAVPAKVRFVSAEPLFEPIDFSPYLPQLDWIIVGCERAAAEDRRPMDLDWVRDIRDQCSRYDVAFFLKQYYDGSTLAKQGLLDGTIQQNFPRSPAPCHPR